MEGNGLINLPCFVGLRICTGSFTIISPFYTRIKRSLKDFLEERGRLFLKANESHGLALE